MNNTIKIRIYKMAFVVLVLCFASQLPGQEEPDQQIFNKGVIDSFTPFNYHTNGEAISLSDGNLFLNPYSLKVQGRSGLDLSLNMTVSSGSQEFIFDRLRLRYPGDASADLDRIVYDNKVTDLGPLGSVRSQTDELSPGTPFTTISYDAGTKGWNTSWADNKGIIILSAVSPHKTFEDGEDLSRRHVLLVKASGAVEMYNYLTGFSLARQTNGKFITPLNADITALNEIALLDASGKQFIFSRTASDAIPYRAERSWQCGNLFYRETCNSSDYYDGWRIDAFILQEVRDQYGNAIRITPLVPLAYETQTITDSLGRSISRRVDAAGEEWTAPTFNNQTALWRFDYDTQGRLARAVDPENNATQYEYDYARAISLFPTVRRGGLVHLGTPTDFMQITYPSGGMIRYETFYSDETQTPETWFNYNKQVIVTEVPDTANTSVFYQKYYIITGREEYVDTLAYDADGSEVAYHFERMNGSTLLRSKKTMAGGQSVLEMYAWNTNPEQKAVNGISSIEVVRDNNKYVSANITYDEIGRTSSVSDALGRTTQYTYAMAPSEIPATSVSATPEAIAALNRVNLVSAVSKSVATGAYDTLINYGGTDSCGKEIKPTLVESVSRRIADGAVEVLKRFCYDEFGNITKVKPGDTGSSDLNLNISYDEHSIYKTSSSQGTKTTTYNYNSGLIETLTYPNGSTTTYSYDKLGRLTRIDYGTDYYVAHEYAPASVKTTIHDGAPSGDFVTTRTYDGLGSLIREDKNGEVRQYSYDPMGRLSAITYGGGKRASLNYDGFGRVIFKQLPGLDPISYSYALINLEGFGPCDSVNTYVGGSITQRKFYDLSGKLVGDIKYAGPSELQTKYSYDSLDQVTEILTPANLAIRNAIDYVNNTLVRTYPGGDTVEIDDVGDLGNLMGTKRSDVFGNNVETDFDYNSANQLTKIDLPASGGREMNDIDFSYGDANTNAEGRIKEIRDYYGKTEFWYGKSGAVEGINRQIGTLDEKYKFQYAKDGFGNETEIRYPHGLAVHYVRDAQRRVKEVRQGSATGLKIAALSYNADGNLSEIRYANGVTTNYAHDLAGRVSRITVHRGENYISDEQYTYDGRGRKTSVTHLDASKTKYAYDESTRLIKAEYFKNGASEAYDTQEYGYDADGNRTTYKDSSKQLQYQSPNNKLAAITRTTTGTDTEPFAEFEYTLGNITRQVEKEHGENVLEKSFSFDASRQLTGVHVADHRTGFETQSSYTYDYSGKRESATVDGETTYYGYGENRDPLIEINDKGEVKSAHIYAGGLRIASIEGDKLKIYHSDELGNTIGVTDENGVVTQTVRYDPFGNVNFLNGPDDNTYLFAGKPFDRATGLIYFGARYYDPETGRYISPDPLAQGTNHYIYAGDNPLSNRDLFGLWFGGGMDTPAGDFGGVDVDIPTMGGVDQGSQFNPIGAFWSGTFYNLLAMGIGLTGVNIPQMNLSSIASMALSATAGDSMIREWLGRKDPDRCYASAKQDTELCIWVDPDNPKKSYVEFFALSTGRDYFSGEYQDFLDYLDSRSKKPSDRHYSDEGGTTPPAPIINNGIPPSENSSDQHRSTTPPISSVGVPSRTFYPPAGGGSGTGAPPPGLPPQNYPGDTTQWTPPSEPPTRPTNVGGLGEQPDKPAPSVQSEHGDQNTTADVNDHGDPIMLHSGEFIQTNVDLKIAGVGLDYEFKRTYRSRITYDGPLGPNWDHNYNKRLLELENGNIARYDGDARFDIYLKNADGSYKSPTGRFDILTKLGSGFRIRDSRGLVTNYDSAGRAVSIADSNGNTMSFTYATIGDNVLLSSVTDTTGRQIAYEYNSSGKLSNVTDFAGRRVELAYDANGDLVSVQSPLTPRTTYSYSSGFAEDRAGLNHNLVSITDAKGQIYLYNEYSVFDRVVRQRFGEDGWFEFDYRELLPSGECVTEAEADDVLYRTRAKDRSGNITVYDFNCQGNPLKIEEFTRGVRASDPESFVTSYTYNADGLVTSVTYPQGDRVALEYERHDGPPAISRLPAGNIARVTKAPDSDRGGGEPLVTSFLYEPLYNKPVRIADPRSFATYLWYDYQEGMNASGVSAVLGIDEGALAGNYSHLALGTGDLNGDGDTSRAGGNLVLVQYPTAHDIAGVGQELVKRFQYNGRGQTTRTIDEGGIVTGYIYNDSGYLTGRTLDPGGLQITHAVTRNQTGEVTFYTDPRGNTERLTLDEGGRILEARDPAGAITRYAYDANYKLTRMDRQNLDGNGAIVARNDWITTTFEYSWLDRLIVKREEIAEGRQAITEYKYDANENLARVIRPQGNSTFIEYDERDLPHKITKGFESASAATTTINYDGDKNATSVTNGLGDVTTYTYDGFNRRISELDPRGTETGTSYDVRGLITEISKRSADGLLSSSNFTFDEAGRLIRRRDALVEGGAISGYAVHAIKLTPKGLPQEITDPEGMITAYSYDSAGRRISTTDPAGNRVIRAYDANGNVLSDTHRAQGDEVMSYDYDALNRKIRQTNGAENSWNYAYDSFGNLLSTLEPNGNATRLEYDGMGRVTRRINSTDGRDIATIYGLDDNSRLISQTDPNGNVTRFEYDTQDRQTAMIMPDGKRYDITYNANSGVAEYLAPDGTRVNFQYDTAGFLTRREYQKGGVSQGRDEFSHDGLGRMVRAVTLRANGSVSSDVEYDYGSLGGIASETQLGAAVASTRNLIGDRTSVSYPGNLAVLESRDPIGRLSGIGRAIADDLAAFGYHDLVRKSSVAYQNGTRGAFGYNDAALLDSISWQKADGTGISVHALAYDAAGSIVTDNATGYTYDGLARLTRDSKFGYAYDDANNFTRVTEIATSATTDFTPNNLNQYTAIGATPISHDENGNVTSDGRFEYLYNWRNQISNVYDLATGDPIADYEYDAIGRRISKFNHQTGEGARYVYDGWRMIEERDSNGDTVASFIYSSLDEPVAMVRDGEIFFYHYDERGSIEAVTNAVGEVVERYSYESFGRVFITDAVGGILAESAIGNPFFFTGQVLDRETGLYYFKNRFYSPALGRFMSRDPIGYVDGVNLYAYVGNDPINFIDPFGLYQEDVHRGLVEYLARQAGFSKEEARLLGEYAQRPDDNILSHPIIQGASDIFLDPVGINKYSYGKQALETWHFPRETGSNRVVPSSPASREIMESGIKNSDLEKFGTGLHVLQDSWSHRGIPALERGFGHPSDRGGLFSVDPDLTFLDPNAANEMAQGVYSEMLNFRRTRGDVDDSQYRDLLNHWDQVQASIQEFVRASSPQDKIRILNGWEVTPNKDRTWDTDFGANSHPKKR